VVSPVSLPSVIARLSMFPPFCQPWRSGVVRADEGVLKVHAAAGVETGFGGAIVVSWSRLRVSGGDAGSGWIGSGSLSLLHPAARRMLRISERDAQVDREAWG